MCRRLLLSVAALAAFAALLLVGGWLLRPHTRIGQETYLKINNGMTQAEIEALIGGPPGNYGVGEGEIDLGASWGLAYQPSPNARLWLGPTVAIEVAFEDGRATSKALYSVWRQYDSEFDRVCQVLHLRPAKARAPMGFIW
jgi:HAMP domain-containing protein